MVNANKMTRRRMLRGTLGAGAVFVGLPLFNLDLNGNGTALASGAPLPERYGTWFWGLGMTKNIFVPKTVGPDYDLPEEIQSFKPVKQHINILTNFRIPTDGKPNLCHFSGWVGIRTGAVPGTRTDLPNPTFDTLIAEQIGAASRFPSLEMAATGDVRDTYSFRNGDLVNAPAVSAVELYQRIFGAGFQDPNSSNFTPDPRIMMRKSVLSAVADDRQRLLAKLGAEDKQRLDQYFTAVRDLESRLAVQLEKPPPAEACRIPAAVPESLPEGLDYEIIEQRHRAMTDLLVLAVACNQTKVFNMVYSNSGSNIVRKGFARTHHITTHEEAPDPKAGYQVESSFFLRRAMESWAYFVNAFASFKEGDGTLLDRSLIFAHSDCELAKIHSIDGTPMMTAGSLNGKVRTGQHIDGKGAMASNMAYTIQKLMGVPVTQWGTGSLGTTKEVSEILA
jgi:hypothetical protein